jgi:hypothetical protein
VQVDELKAKLAEMAKGMEVMMTHVKGMLEKKAEDAATTIQAMYRGRRARKAFRSSTAAAAATVDGVCALHHGGEVVRHQERANFLKGTALAKAATTIQAMIRGRRAREAFRRSTAAAAAAAVGAACAIQAMIRGKYVRLAKKKEVSKYQGSSWCGIE